MPNFLESLQWKIFLSTARGNDISEMSDSLLSVISFCNFWIFIRIKSEYILQYSSVCSPQISFYSVVYEFGKLCGE